MLVLKIDGSTDADDIEAAIPFLDMRSHAISESSEGRELELHEFGDVVVLYSPAYRYAYVNEHSPGVGNSLIVESGDADSAEHAAQQWRANEGQA